MPEATGGALVASLRAAAEAQGRVQAAAVEAAEQAKVDRQPPPPAADEPLPEPSHVPTDQVGRNG